MRIPALGCIGPVGAIHFVPRQNRDRWARPLLEKYILYPQGLEGVRRVRRGPGRGRVGPGQLLHGEASGVGTVVEGEFVGDGDERMDGNAGGLADAGGGGDGDVVNVCDLSHTLLNRMAHHRCRQGAALLPGLNHRTLAASAGDSGKVVMGVVVDGNVGNYKGSKVLGDVAVGAGGGVRWQSGQFLFNSRRIPVALLSILRVGRHRTLAIIPAESDTECVVWLFQRFHCRETWGRDPCSPGPAP